MSEVKIKDPLSTTSHKYPWYLWCDGKQRHFKRGVDFVNDETFRVACRKESRARGLVAKTAVTEIGVLFRAELKPCPNT